MVKKREKIFAKPPERFDDAGEDRFALGNGVTGFLIEFPNERSPARLGKGTLRVPLGERVAYGGIDEELLPSWCHSHDVHNGVFRIVCLEGIEVVIVVKLRRGLGGGGGEFGNGDLPVNPETGLFCDFGELGADGGVEKRDPSTNFAAERVKK